MIDYRALARVEPHPRPITRIEIDGIGLAGILSQRFISCIHTDNRGFEADTVELTLDDSDGALDLPPRGAILSLEIGWQQTGLVPKGSYTVDEITHTGAPDTLVIHARSVDLRAGLATQQERSWHATTLGNIVQTIAAEHDLKPAIAASLASQPIDHLDQTNESAINLLTRLAYRYDAIATVKDGRLLFVPAGGGVSASGKPIPAVTIVRASGDRHTFTIADRQTYGAVRALYHDIAGATKGEVIWGNAEDSSERKVKPAAQAAPTTGQYKSLTSTYTTRDKAQRAAQAEWKRLKANKAARAAYIGVKAHYNNKALSVSGDVTWGQADDQRKLQAAQRTAERDAQKLVGSNNAIPHSTDNLKTLRHVYSSRANAQRAARAEWRRLLRGMATFAITLAHGDPTLYPETPATVAGFKPQIDNTDWIITRVVNTTSDAGYIQQIELEIKATEVPD